jgi:hypothetical protein
MKLTFGEYKQIRNIMQQFLEVSTVVS